MWYVNFMPWLLPAIPSVCRLAGWTAREEAPKQGGQEPPGVGGQAARATQTTSGGGAGLCLYVMPSVSWEELLLFFQIFFPFIMMVLFW